MFLVVSLQDISVIQPATLAAAGENLGGQIEISSLGYDKLARLVVGQSRIKIPITAYSSTPDQTDDSPFITASGTHVRDGIVATNFLKMGTKVMIPELFGNKVFVVEDRMNRRYFHRMDIWFADRASARKFGLQNAEVVILN